MALPYHHSRLVQRRDRNNICSSGTRDHLCGPSSSAATSQWTQEERQHNLDWARQHSCFCSHKLMPQLRLRHHYIRSHGPRHCTTRPSSHHAWTGGEAQAD